MIDGISQIKHKSRTQIIHKNLNKLRTFFTTFYSYRNITNLKKQFLLFR